MFLTQGYPYSNGVGNENRSVYLFIYLLLLFYNYFSKRDIFPLNNLILACYLSIGNNIVAYYIEYRISSSSQWHAEQKKNI